MATFQVSTPTPFNFSKPEEWPKWLKRFKRFRQASKLCKKSGESQVNTLPYTIGEKADDILQSFNLNGEELQSYDTVVERFQRHFVSRQNIIFERAKFNSPGQLHDELIRDRIVVGIRDIDVRKAATGSTSGLAKSSQCS